MDKDIKPVEYSSACSIAHIDKCYRETVSAIGDDGPICVDLSKVESADISFIQLIVAVARRAEAQRRPFGITNMPAAIAASFRGAGVDVERLVRADVKS